LGGGFIDNKEAGALLAARGGRIVFLAVSAQTAWNRIAAAQAESGELPAFKRLKSLFKYHEIPVHVEASARAWFYGKLSPFVKRG
jgi:shikimate kinase